MKIDSFAAFVAEARKTGRRLWEVALADQSADSGQSPDETLGRMARVLHVMREALSQYDPAARSESGLSGGAAARLRGAAAAGRTLSGPFLSDVMSRALMMAEMNACMGRIVAAPTAGSCGVLPSVILSACEHLRLRGRGSCPAGGGRRGLSSRRVRRYRARRRLPGRSWQRLDGGDALSR